MRARGRVEVREREREMAIGAASSQEKRSGPAEVRGHHEGWRNRFFSSRGLMTNRDPHTTPRRPRGVMVRITLNVENQFIEKDII
jgi:hypothetical protein